MISFLRFFLIFVCCAHLGHASDAEEYMLHYSLNLGKSKVREAIFSPDSRFIFTLSQRHKIEIWSFTTGKRLKAILTKKHKALSLTAHPSLPIIYTGGRDHNIQIWDIEHGHVKGVLRGHIGNVNTLAINRDGNVLVSGGADGSLIIWDLPGLVSSHVIKKAHSKSIQTVAFDPKESVVATGGRDGRIRIWDLSTQQMTHELRGHKRAVTKVLFHTNGNQLISASDDKTIRVWDWKSNQLVTTMEGHEDAVTMIDFSRTKEYVISSSKDKSIRIWDIDLGKEEMKLPLVEDEATLVHFDSIGRQVIAGFKKGRVKTWKLGVSATLESFKAHDLSVLGLAFTQNNQLISSSLDKEIRIWDIQSREEVGQIHTENHRAQDLLLLRNDQVLVTAGMDSNVGVWNLGTGTLLNYLKGHKGKVNQLVSHPSKPVVLSASADRSWAMWDLTQMKSMKQVDGHRDQVSTIRFSPNGRYVLTGSHDGSIKVWGYPDGTLLESHEEHHKKVTSIAFHPKRSLFASASADTTIKIWKLTGGRASLINTLEGHSFIVNDLVFSADGSKLISISKDKTARLWDVNKASLIRILSGEASPVQSLAMNADGKVIAIGTLKGQITLLKGPTDLTADSEDFHTPTHQATKTAPTENEQIIDEPKSSWFAQETIDHSLLEDDEDEKQFKMIYKLEKKENLEEKRLSLQEQLNQLLSQKSFCNNADRIQTLAFEVLEMYPRDQAAYHAILKYAMTQKDLKMIFLTAKLGQKARFSKEIYSYTLPINAQNDFDYWIKEVFDPSYFRRGKPLDLSIQDCEKQQHQVSYPDVLKYIDVPESWVEGVLSKRQFLRLKHFQGMKDDSFKQQVLRQVYQDHITKDQNEDLALDAQSLSFQTGEMRLNLQDLQLWGSAEYVEFKLRLQEGDWNVYYTDKDKVKHLLLPVGDYYLKIGPRIKRAFIISPDSRVDITIDNELVF